MRHCHILSHDHPPFRNREEAGRLLGGALLRWKDQEPVVLGIPRGGVVIAKEIADGLECDLDAILTHKIGYPAQPELAIGAVTESGKAFVDKSYLLWEDPHFFRQEKAHQHQLLLERLRLYRDILSKASLSKRTVIVTDDGVATGSTLRAALWAVRQEHPKKLIAAVPAGPEDLVKKLTELADEVVCLHASASFYSVGQFYIEFHQVGDEEVLNILRGEANKIKAAYRDGVPGLRLPKDESAKSHEEVKVQIQ